MTGLWKLGLIILIIIAFVVATKTIADRSFTSDKGTLATGTVVPTAQQNAQAPLRIRIALFQGKAHLPQPDEVAIDEIELNTEDKTRDFELDAGKGDGSEFFVYAMVEPLGFGLRMEGLQHVPEPLWWLLGAIVSFYFGAREFHYWRGGALPSVASARTVVETGGRVKAPVAEPEEDAPLSLGALRPKGRIAAADPYYNAALEEWRGRR